MSDAETTLPNAAAKPKLFTNPVYPRAFPDPFLLKHRGRYYGYCTGFCRDGNVFKIITSDDLVTWTEVGSAMMPLSDTPPFYWAPEVTYYNGIFYLYYSAGNETLMHLRVAVSDRPDRDFIDAGRRLTSEEFAIDAHIFTDDDGARYMFYATDFLEHTHIGTGTVVDRMVDWFQLEGKPRPVTRAKHDWQVYDPRRIEKGGVRWHTIEGPSVLKRKEKYFEMFSGGNWQNTTYGVSFAVSDKVLSDEEWTQFSDGVRVMPILGTIPETVIGPGHNSIVRGPNNRELFCVYHSWIDGERVMSIDRLGFAGDRIFVVGPTPTPQLYPLQPSVYDDSGAPTGQIVERQWSGDWYNSDSGLTSSDQGICERIFAVESFFLFETTLRCISWTTERASINISLKDGETLQLNFSIDPKLLCGALYLPNASADAISEFHLPSDCSLFFDHLLTIVVNGNSFAAYVDGKLTAATRELNFKPTSLAIRTENTSVEFTATTLTVGFEDLFETAGDLRNYGYELKGAFAEAPTVSCGQFSLGSTDNCSITKGAFSDNAEFVANLASVKECGEKCEFGIAIVDDGGRDLVKLSASEKEIKLTSPATGVAVSQDALFPAGYYRQFRLLQSGSSLDAYLDGQLIGRIDLSRSSGRPTVFCCRGTVSVEMVRLTEF